MEEKTYKIMSGSGATSIAVGVVTLVTGLVCGHPDDRKRSKAPSWKIQNIILTREGIPDGRNAFCRRTPMRN